MLLANPGAADARVSKEAESLVAAGHDVTVYCLAAPGLPADERRNHVRYVRCAEPHRRFAARSGRAAASTPVSGLRTRDAGTRTIGSAVLGAAVSAAKGPLTWVKAALAPFVAHELLAATFVARVVADQPDVVHAHDYEVLPAAVRIARRVQAITGTRPSLVYDMHEYEPGRWPVAGPLLARWKSFVEARAVRRVDAAITVSPAISTTFARVHRRGEPTLVLNAPVAPAASGTTAGLRQTLGLDAQAPLAVHVGTVSAGRGMAALLEAAARLPRLHLALLGNVRPELAQTLKAAAADPRLAGRLHVLPPVPHAEVVPFIASADLGICAIEKICRSYDYTIPNKLLECALAGLPLVVSNTRGMAPLARELGNSVVADTSSPERLAAAITRALTRRADLKPTPERLAELRSRFGWEAQAEQLTGLYARIAEQRHFTAAVQAVQRRRVLMVNLIDWRTMCGGAQHQLGLFGAWSAAGHDVQMLTPRRNGGAQPPGLAASAVHGIPSVRGLRLPAGLDTLVQAAVLPWLVHKHHPDVVYSRHNTFTPALVLMCRLLRVPVFVEHNSWLPSQRRVAAGSSWVGNLEGFGQQLASRWADGARTVTPGLTRHLTALGVPQHQLTAIGNGTDTERFRPIDRAAAFSQFGLDPALTTVGFIGNIMPWHGMDQAVAGFAIAARQFPDADLVVFGDGPGVPALKAEAERLGIGHRVRWMGRVPLEAANAAINCLDVALLPLSAQHDIGFGFSAIKLRDYAAAGRIVLTSRLPGAIELEDEPWLFTHLPDNAADLGARLADVLARVHSDPAARQAARAYAEAHFDWRQITGQIDLFVASRLSARRA